MLNIVHFAYVPNTASTNRLLSYLNNIPENITVNLYLLMPCPERSEINNLPSNIRVIYCWKKFRPVVRLFTPITYFLSLIYVRTKLIKGDVVYCYNIPHYINNLFKKGVRYYGERTESPEVTTSPSRLMPFSLEKHLKLCRKLDGVFVISTALRDYYISQGVEKNKIHIINMTVDPTRFDNVQKIESDQKYIAYCGNVSNTKDGLDNLLRAFSIVVKEYPEIYLYIIGKGSIEDENYNTSLIKSLGISRNVVFTGLVPAEQMPQLLKNAEMCVLARSESIQSRCGFPTKLGEYLLTGNPVVITDVGDISLFLEDNVSALIAPPGDVKDFAAKILWLLRHPSEGHEIGKRGREVAQMHFNASSEVSKLIEIMQV